MNGKGRLISYEFVCIHTYSTQIYVFRTQGQTQASTVEVQVYLKDMIKFCPPSAIFLVTNFLTGYLYLDLNELLMRRKTFGITYTYDGRHFFFI